MQIGLLLLRTGASLGFTYTLFILWTAAGIAGLIGFALVLYGGLQLVRGDERSLEQWPLLRRLLRRRR
jgi:hypothetical protein